VYAPSSTVGPMENVVVSAGGTNGQLAGGGTTSTSIAFPGATLGVGATLTLDASSTPPNGIVSAATRRVAQNGVSVLEYLLVEASQTVNFTGTPALQFVLPAADVNALGTYTLEIYNSNSAGAGFTTLSTGVLSGSTVSFAAGTTAFSVPATPAFVVFALVLTLPGPSPSPSPTASASPTPSGSPTATPSPGSNSLTPSATYLIFASATAAPQAFTITELNGAALTESDTCTTAGVTIVSVLPSGTTTPTANVLNVSVTPHAVGTCSITYQDSVGNSASVGVTVSNPAPIVIQ